MVSLPAFNKTARIIVSSSANSRPPHDALCVLAAVIEQPLADILPNRVRPTKPDCVRLLYLDDPETA
jgi:hypothetical protein